MTIDGDVSVWELGYLAVDASEDVALAEVLAPLRAAGLAEPPDWVVSEWSMVLFATSAELGSFGPHVPLDRGLVVTGLAELFVGAADMSEVLARAVWLWRAHDAMFVGDDEVRDPDEVLAGFGPVAGMERWRVIGLAQFDFPDRVRRGVATGCAYADLIDVFAMSTDWVLAAAALSNPLCRRSTVERVVETGSAWLRMDLWNAGVLPDDLRAVERARFAAAELVDDCGNPTPIAKALAWSQDVDLLAMLAERCLVEGLEECVQVANLLIGNDLTPQFWLDAFAVQGADRLGLRLAAKVESAAAKAAALAHDEMWLWLIQNPGIDAATLEVMLSRLERSSQHLVALHPACPDRLVDLWFAGDLGQPVGDADLDVLWDATLKVRPSDYALGRLAAHRSASVRKQVADMWLRFLPSAAVEALLADPKVDVVLAAHRSLDAETFARVSMTVAPGSVALVMLAENSATPVEVLMRVTEVALKSHGWSGSIPHPIEMMLRRDMPVEWWAIMAEHPQTLMRRAAASSVRCPAEVLERLAVLDGLAVAEAVAANPSTPPSVLSRLCDEGFGSALLFESLLIGAAGNPSSPPDLLGVLAGRPELGIARAVAGNRSTPPDALVRLLDYPVDSVRAAAVTNRSLPAACVAESRSLVDWLSPTWHTDRPPF